MKIQKLNNGKYRIRPMINGEQRCFTFDHRPSMLEINKVIAESSKGGTETVRHALSEYIEMKEAVLSPSTIRSYRAYFKNIPDDFLKIKLRDLDSIQLQKLVNRYVAEHSIKYAKNVCGLLVSVLGLFEPEKNIKVTYPKKVTEPPYNPSDDDIKRILDEAKGTRYEVALWLACFGIRRGEQICLEESDLDGNILTISKSMVLNSEKKWVIKETKTAASTRQIILPDHVVELIHKNGFYKGHPNTIVKWLYQAQKRLGIPQFSLHYFRHFFAAKMSTITDEATVLQLGGWKTDHVFKSRYRYALPENVERAKSEATQLIDSLI